MKGMIYTTFAIIAASLILFIASLQVSTVGIESSDATRIGEASFFMESVLDDMDRSLAIATRRALTGSINFVVKNGEPVKSPRKNVTSVMVNGTLAGEELNSTENASLSDWTSKVSTIADRSGYNLEVVVKGYDLNSTGLDVDASYSVFARLEDPATRAAFNVSKSTEEEVSISGLEDTMLLLQSRGRYISSYTDCGFEKPAKELYTGTYHSTGYVHGRSVVNPADAGAVTGASEKILVVDDIDSYATNDVNNFAGAVSSQANSSGGYTTDYVFGTGSIDGIDDNASLILNDDEVWASHFREMFLEGCYVEDPRGPDFFDRLGNEMVGENGVSTMIQVSELPPELQRQESAVGYVYFNGTGYGPLHSIKGVSSEYTWFRLDDYHVDLWSLNSLTY